MTSGENTAEAFVTMKAAIAKRYWTRIACLRHAGETECTGHDALFFALQQNRSQETLLTGNGN